MKVAANGSVGIVSQSAGFTIKAEVDGGKLSGSFSLVCQADLLIKDKHQTLSFGGACTGLSAIDGENGPIGFFHGAGMVPLIKADATGKPVPPPVWTPVKVLITVDKNSAEVLVVRADNDDPIATYRWQAWSAAPHAVAVEL